MCQLVCSSVAACFACMVGEERLVRALYCTAGRAAMAHLLVTAPCLAGGGGPSSVTTVSRARAKGSRPPDEEARTPRRSSPPYEGQGAVGEVTGGSGWRPMTADARCCPRFADRLRTQHGPAGYRPGPAGPTPPEEPPGSPLESTEPPRVYRRLWSAPGSVESGSWILHATVVGWRVSNSIGLSMPSELWRRWRLWKISR